jgi:predicted P-loop ATPase
MATQEKSFRFEFSEGVSPQTYDEALSLDDIAKMLRSPGTKKREKSYLPGELKNHHRKSMNVINRSVITLDLDGALEGGFEALSGFLSDFYYFWHTTYSHSEEKPSYRFLVPLDEPVTPGQYGDLVRQIIAANPQASIDAASAKPAQIMFTPACKDPFSYDYGVHEGKLADGAQWLSSANGGEAVVPLARVQRRVAPEDAPGIVGQFNRVYPDLDELIATFELPYEYDGATGRYRYTGSSASATPGMREIEENPGYYYSWHAHDPAAGYAQNAFDLVRIHKFGHLDGDYKGPVNRAPSYTACRDFLDTHKNFNKRAAAQAYEVVASKIATQETSGAEPTEPARESSTSVEVLTTEDIDNTQWVSLLEVDRKTGKFVDSLRNLTLIFDNDPKMKGVGWCERGEYFTEADPHNWPDTKQSPKLTENQKVLLRNRYENIYGLKVSPERLVQIFAERKVVNSFDPVRVYLESLHWDGNKRMETCLPGVEDTEYNRMVARKVLLAAVARAFEPGVKVDEALILVGSEGTGKSSWIKEMSKGFSVEFQNIESKDTVQILSETWIAMAEESEVVAKSDFNRLKSFLTQTSDTYRVPYAVEPETRLRRWVVWGSTNDMELLRERDGNRRFLMVECVRPRDFDLLTPEYVDQIWAEAVHAYLMGESHVMNSYERELAKSAREQHIHSDALTESIAEHLRLPITSDWHEKKPETLRSIVGQWNVDVIGSTGDKERDFITPKEVWVEIEGMSLADFTLRDQSRVKDSLQALVRRGVLTRSETKIRVPNQGKQFLYFVNHDKLDD